MFLTVFDHKLSVFERLSSMFFVSSVVYLIYLLPPRRDLSDNLHKQLKYQIPCNTNHTVS